MIDSYEIYISTISIHGVTFPIYNSTEQAITVDDDGTVKIWENFPIYLHLERKWWCNFSNGTKIGTIYFSLPTNINFRDEIYSSSGYKLS